MAKQIRERLPGEEVPTRRPVRRPQTAEEVVGLIEHHMPALRRVQANSGCRALRTVLMAVETIVEEREQASVPARLVAPPPDD